MLIHTTALLQKQRAQATVEIVDGITAASIYKCGICETPYSGRRARSYRSDREKRALSQLQNISIEQACQTLTDPDFRGNPSFNTDVGIAYKCKSCSKITAPMPSVLLRKRIADRARAMCRGLCLYCLRGGKENPDECVEKHK